MTPVACPFCGEPAEIGPAVSGRVQQMICATCGARGPEVLSNKPFAEVLDAWNRRSAADVALCPGHSWRDFGQLAGKNVSRCSRCDALAFTGQEPDGRCGVPMLRQAERYEAVGTFMEDGGRWLRMDASYANDPDAVTLYRRTAGVTAAPATQPHDWREGLGYWQCPTVEQVLNCADVYGDARVMASRGRAGRPEVDEARKELRALVERAIAVKTPDSETK